MSRWFVLTALALCALLPLAWLQYRWANQLAAAEQQRLGAYLDTASARFAGDLDDYLMRQPLRPTGPLNEEPAPFLFDPADPGLIAFQAGPFDEWAMAELDMASLTGDLLPRLFARHYPGTAGLEFDAVIMDTATPPRLIWASKPGLTSAGLGKPDAATGLLHYRPGPATRGFNGPPPGSPGPPGDARGPRGPAPWQLLLRHRAGSLEQAVNATRHQNLALSAAVLLLLALALAAMLVSTRRAQELARRQMEFVAGVSHELRTPLSVIGSAAGNLADGVVSAPPQVRQYGTLIQNEGRRLNIMVDQIMRFAGIQSGRFQPQLQPTALGPVLAEAIGTTAAELQRAGMALVQAIPPDLPLILADPASLAQGIGNLLANAAIHASSGRQVTLSATAGPGAVSIIVDDRGPGITPTERPHLFEPFFRGRTARDAQIHGFGLGLALAHRIAQAHNATLTCENRPSGGARFILKLPVAPQP